MNTPIEDKIEECEKMMHSYKMHMGKCKGRDPSYQYFKGHYLAYEAMKASLKEALPAERKAIEEAYVAGIKTKLPEELRDIPSQWDMMDNAAATKYFTSKYTNNG